MNKSIQYPLLYNYTDYIAGNGFLASVQLYGKALMVKEYGEWWMYGVQPVAIADRGEIPEIASANFRERYKTVLFDFVDEASGYEGFKSETEKFFTHTEEEMNGSWEKAFKLIRSGKVKLEKPFSQLEKKKPEIQMPKIEVNKIMPEVLSSANNALDVKRIAA